MFENYSWTMNSFDIKNQYSLYMYCTKFKYLKKKQFHYFSYFNIYSAMYNVLFTHCSVLYCFVLYCIVYYIVHIGYWAYIASIRNIYYTFRISAFLLFVIYYILRFYFDGEDLEACDTSETLDLEGGECIDVHLTNPD